MSLGRRPQRATKAPSGEAAAKADEARAAEAAKTLRLRALRLAKEAADRDAAQRMAALQAKHKPTPRVQARTRNPA
jgi:hypothetical protein